jgi:hypothetical protein
MLFCFFYILQPVKNKMATAMFPINTGNNINKNSGAESTIEALLTMQ